MENTTIIAALLGLLEGLTEFIPVSSTGHILLAGHFLGFDSAGKTFEVVIQLGAVLAILTLYASRLTSVFMAAPHDPGARWFIASVLLAFLPAAVIGVPHEKWGETVKALVVLNDGATATEAPSARRLGRLTTTHRIPPPASQRSRPTVSSEPRGCGRGPVG